MAVENFEKFLKLVGEDQDVAKKFEAISSDLNAVIQLGKEQGCAFTTEDMKAYHEQHDNELSDEELDSVAGGGVTSFAACVAAGAAVVSAATSVAGNLRY